MSETKVSIPRLRRIKFKDGRILEIFRTDNLKFKREILEKVHATLGYYGSELPLMGYAFVCWAADEASSVSFDNLDGSPVPDMLIPDFVRNRLLTERAVRWSVDAIEERLFGPKPPDAS